MMPHRISKELHTRIFELTLALYRVTDFFPQNEALRRQLREKANEIFGGVTEYGFSNNLEQETLALLGYIQSLKGYCAVARSLRFVKPINLSVLEREYDIVSHFFQKELHNREQEDDLHLQKEVVKNEPIVRSASIVKSSVKKELLNDRQNLIMRHLGNSGQAKISDFYSLFNGVSSKTIQRDLQDLVVKDILKKEGDKRWTTYFIK